MQSSITKIQYMEKYVKKHSLVCFIGLLQFKTNFVIIMCNMWVSNETDIDKSVAENYSRTIDVLKDNMALLKKSTFSYFFSESHALWKITS